MAYPSPPMTEEEWFPPGGPHPTTVSPTLMVARPPAQIPEGLLGLRRPARLAALTARFTIAELCDLAAERDAGFHGSRLSDRLAAFGEIPTAEFARYALYRVDYDRLRATIAAAAEEVARLHPGPDPSGFDV